MPIDLTTEYCGLKLSSPLVVSACPLTGRIESLKELCDAGAAAAVLPSIFEEQFVHHEMDLFELLETRNFSSSEAHDYFPQLDSYNTGTEEYLDLIAQAKKTVTMPIIASLNGSTVGGWARYASQIESAGADALELNIYQLPTTPRFDSCCIEADYCRLVRAVKDRVKIPVAVKIGPYYSALPHLSNELAKAGASGLVMFNRYLAPDIDLDTLTFVPSLKLSTSDELLVALRWIAILRDQIEISLSANGGVHTSEDVVKALLCGADIVEIASVLLQNGSSHLGVLKQGLSEWLSRHEYVSVRQLKGSMSMNKCASPEGLLRANYMRALTSFASNDKGFKNSHSPAYEREDGSL